MKTTEDLHALAALAEAATPGPWTVRKVGDGRDQSAIDPDVVVGTTDGVSIARADATFIAAASPDVVRELVARVLEAEATIADLISIMRLNDLGAAVAEFMKRDEVRRAVEASR